MCVCVCVCVCVKDCSVVPLLLSQSYHSSSLPLMTMAMVVLTSAILATISLTGVVFYGLAVFSLTFVCPLLFVRLQHLKK